MADAEPQALPIPDNHDVTANPVATIVLETTDAGLDDPGVQAKSGAEGTDLLKRVIAERVVGLIETDANGLPRQTERSGEAGELSPEQVTFMGTLKARYERNQHRLACHDSVAWAKVEAKLSANPSKLDALKKMNDSGGEPDMTGVEGEEFLFDDLAAKLPDCRRGLTYAQAVARARAMGGGAKLTHHNRYKKLGDEMRIVMDIGSDWAWLDTSDLKDLLDSGAACCGLQRNGIAYVGQAGAGYCHPYGVFRCSLRV